MYSVKKIFKTTALSFLAAITLFGNIVSATKNLENKDLEITNLNGKEIQLELFNEENDQKIKENKNPIIPDNDLNNKYIINNNTKKRETDYYKKLDTKCVYSTSNTKNIEKYDYRYKTDKYGRIKKFQTNKLVLSKNLKRRTPAFVNYKNEKNNETHVWKIKNGYLPEDDYGHLIAHEFGGSDNIDNTIPMNGKRLNKKHGIYRNIEEKLKEKLKVHQNIQIKGKIIYDNNDESLSVKESLSPEERRPKSIELEYEAEDEHISYKIANKKEEEYKDDNDADYKTLKYASMINENINAEKSNSKSKATIKKERTQKPEEETNQETSEKKSKEIQRIYESRIEKIKNMIKYKLLSENKFYWHDFPYIKAILNEEKFKTKKEILLRKVIKEVRSNFTTYHQLENRIKSKIKIKTKDEDHKNIINQLKTELLNQLHIIINQENEETSRSI